MSTFRLRQQQSSRLRVQEKNEGNSGSIQHRAGLFVLALPQQMLLPTALQVPDKQEARGQEGYES